MSKEKISGLGDVIKTVTSALGIEACDACEERRKTLNKLFPFTKNAAELSQDDIEFLKRIRFSNTIGAEDAQYLFMLNNRVFNSRITYCNCSGLTLEIRDKLWTLYLANYSQNINEQ